MVIAVDFFPDRSVAGHDGWYWVVGDEGAWDGPAKDWEKSHVEKIVGRMVDTRRTGEVIQAGGCCGMYPRLLAGYFDRVFTFEPDPTSFEALTLNCSGYPGIVARNVALGASPGSVSMIVQDPKNVGMNVVVEGGSIERIRLDDLELNPDLIWLDVEGAEVDALEGARKTIARTWPVIVVENPGSRFDRVLREMGYSLVDRSVADGIYERR